MSTQITVIPAYQNWSECH